MKHVAKIISLWFVVLTVMTSGCTSMRTYLAPTAEDRECWRAEDEEEARELKAKDNLLGGPFGSFLYFTAMIGKAFLP